MLGVALLLTAASLIFRQRLLALARRRSASADFSQRHVAGLTLVVGAVLGVLVTISSVGAGALGVTALSFLYPNLPTLRIVGSDIAHAVPLTAVAGLGHWALGTIDVALLGSLLIGSLPGIWLGSHFSPSSPSACCVPSCCRTGAGGRKTDSRFKHGDSYVPLRRIDQQS